MPFYIEAENSALVLVKPAEGKTLPKNLFDSSKLVNILN